MLKQSERMKDEAKFVVRCLGDTTICNTCRATLPTYADKCTAGLSDACEGFMLIEKAKETFARLRAAHDRLTGKV